MDRQRTKPVRGPSPPSRLWLGRTVPSSTLSEHTRRNSLLIHALTAYLY